MVLALNGKWIWDFWLVDDKTSDDGLWHVYFLQSDNNLPSPKERHRHVTQGHAISIDLINWTHLGQCFAPSKTKSWDDWTTWTGSVLKDSSGLWHLFYTGTSHELGGKHQRIGHATSNDMHSWQRVGNGLILDREGTNAEYYEEYTPGRWHDRAFRDPWVMRNPVGDGWIMYFIARVPGRPKPNDAGAIGFATSHDLYSWKLEKPIYDSGDFGELEVPQVFKHGNLWYMTFCTGDVFWSERYASFSGQLPVTGNHYLIAESHLGPWRAPKPFLDGFNPPRRYAGKIVDLNGRLHMMGFSHDNARGGFLGIVGDPVPLVVDVEGYLHLDGRF